MNKDQHVDFSGVMSKGLIPTYGLTQGGSVLFLL